MCVRIGEKYFMRVFSKETAMLNIEQYTELKKVLSAAENLNYAVIKGEPLSVLCYNKKSMRNSGDIDILIPRDCLAYFESILSDNGFKVLNQPEKHISRMNRVLCLNQSHQIEPYVKELTNCFIQIDINFDIFWGEYDGNRVDIDKFLFDAVTMDIYSCPIKTLPPLKAMVQLILHSYKDLNSIFLLATRRTIKSDMFEDIFYLLKNNLESISVNNLYDLGTEYGIIPYIYYVLYHTGLIFTDDRDLKRYIDAFRTPEGISFINFYGLNESERQEWKVDFYSRLKSDNLYDLIKENLSEKDVRKLKINSEVF